MYLSAITALRRICVELFLLTILLAPVCQGDSHVSLVNNGPVVMGSPIRFTANVTFHDEAPPRQLIYEFWDTFKPPHKHSIGPVNSTVVNYTLTFDNWRHNVNGFYLMSVRVYRYRTGHNDKLLGEWSTAYTITRMLEGKIDVLQNSSVSRRMNHVATGASTQLTARVHDPMQYLKSAVTVDYVWSMDGNSNFGPNDLPTIGYNFTQVGAVTVRCVVAARFISNHTTSVTSSGRDVQLNAQQQLEDGDVDEFLQETSIQMIYGVFSVVVVVDAPVTVVRVNGDTSLRNGAMLNLTMSCNGSSPWYYCVLIQHGLYNVTGNETCSSGEKIEDKCMRRYYRYLANNSTYTAVFVVGNDVSRRVAKVDITVNMIPIQQLSYYIVPLSCALLAIVFIMFGSVKLVKSRRDYNLEIADFDFEPRRSSSRGRDGGGLEGEVSFWRRVRYTVLPDFGGWWRRMRAATGRATSDDSGRASSDDRESAPVLARERTHRLSYGIIEDYSD